MRLQLGGYNSGPGEHGQQRGDGSGGPGHLQLVSHPLQHLPSWVCHGVLVSTAGVSTRLAGYRSVECQGALPRLVCQGATMDISHGNQRSEQQMKPASGPDPTHDTLTAQTS